MRRHLGNLADESLAVGSSTLALGLVDGLLGFFQVLLASAIVLSDYPLDLCRESRLVSNVMSRSRRIAKKDFLAPDSA